MTITMDKKRWPAKAKLSPFARNLLAEWQRLALPARLDGLMTAPERFDVLPNDASAVEAYVLARARAVSQGAA